MFRPPIHDIPNIVSVGGVLLHLPETPYSGPEVSTIRSRSKVVLHGVTELLLHRWFCLINHQHCILLKHSHRPKRPDKTQPAGVHQRVVGLLQRQAPTTLQPQLWSAASTMEARNMAHFNSRSPASPGSVQSSAGGGR